MRLPGYYFFRDPRENPHITTGVYLYYLWEPRRSSVVEWTRVQEDIETTTDVFDWENPVPVFYSNCISHDSRLYVKKQYL